MRLEIGLAVFACTCITALFIANVTITLILVDEIRDEKIDNQKVKFVEVVNWLYVAMMGTGFLLMMYMTPGIVRYMNQNQQRKSYVLSSDNSDDE